MAGQTAMQQHFLAGRTIPTRLSPQTRSFPRSAVVARAEADLHATDRRSALSLLVGAAALLSARPSQAAFGDAANVFGKATNTSGLIPYRGEGFSVDLPSKWSPSREREIPNIVLRYEDTGDQVNSVVIFKKKAGKGSVTDFGDATSFLQSNAYLFGENVWKGDTRSEGGFKQNQVSKANLIEAHVDNKNGKPYYKMEVLTQSADGNEGGKHNLIVATVGGGDLWVCKVQIGDKRWFKGANKAGKSISDTFTVA